VSGYVDETGRHWDDGLIQALSDPNHFKITPCEVVDYSAAPPPDDDLLLPSLGGSPEPEPEPPGRWARLRKAWRGE
jgi:hypothetical protein